jgi:hypothetical protein
MKIGDVLKQSWAIVWRHKILWLFGLFAAEAGGSGISGNFNSGNSFSPSSFNTSSSQTSELGYQITRTLAEWWPVLVAGLVFLILIGIIWWILSVAARGGIVALADDADAGREVHGSHGWSVGFHYWGRVFLQSFVFGLPIFLITLAFIVIIFLVAGGSIAAIASGARTGGSPGMAAGGVLGLLAGVCGFTAVFFVVILAIAIVYAVLVPVSLRYAILHDRPAVQAIGDGWRLVRTQLGKVALTAVTLWGLGIVFGIGLFVVLLIFIVPVVFAALAKVWVAVAFFGVLLIIAAMFAGAIWSAYYSTAWTVAFRAITDPGAIAAEKPGIPVIPPYMPPGPPAAPAAVTAPAPVVAPAPPATPAAPATPDTPAPPAASAPEPAPAPAPEPPPATPEPAAEPAPAAPAPEAAAEPAPATPAAKAPEPPAVPPAPAS